VKGLGFLKEGDPMEWHDYDSDINFWSSSKVSLEEKYSKGRSPNENNKLEIGLEEP
jgi:hypothetical protein